MFRRDAACDTSRSGTRSRAVTARPNSVGSVRRFSPTVQIIAISRSQLTSAKFSYSPSTGIGSSAQPFQGTVTSYLQQFINQQSNASTLANQLQQGQSVVVSTLQQKFNSTAGVNIDTEMSNLIAVQNAYAANAHIMSVVQSMMNTLLQAQV